jgi:hypothetical protein
MDHRANTMRCVCVTAAVWVFLLMLPAIAWAQATITGTTKDTSGAVLPGVTVEAASPALIERVRSVVTDGTGQYRIVDLRPGTYIVTFTLPGFSTIRREGIELSGGFTATVDASLPVGSLEESLTVTAESPVVDLKTARREQVVNRELLSSIPSARTYQTMVGLAPGVTTSGSQDVGGLNSPATRTFAIHGGPQTEGRVMVDGMNAGGARGGAGVSNYQVIGRAGRGGNGWADHERRAANGRQHLHWFVLLQRRQQRVAGEQPHAGTAGRRPERPE